MADSTESVMEIDVQAKIVTNALVSSVDESIIEHSAEKEMEVDDHNKENDSACSIKNKSLSSPYVKPITTSSDLKSNLDNFQCLRSEAENIQSVPETFEVALNNSQLRTNEAQELSSDETKEKGVMSNGNDESQCSEDQFQHAQSCYCGKKRNLNIVELQCGSCLKWFHEDCITIPIGKCVPFMTYYTFFCKLCNPTSTETFSKKQPSFSQICATALANLMQQCAAEGQIRTMFSKDKEVIPYIVAHWEYITPMQRRIKQTWHTTVHKAMLKDTDTFICEEKGYSNTLGQYPMFGLVNQDLLKMGPSYDTTSKSGPQKVNVDSSLSQASAFSGSKGRSNKRKFFDSQMSNAKRVKSDLVMPKLPPNGYPLEHPFNKDGYRYILAEPDPHAPFRQEFDESQDWAGKPIPGWLYRKLTPCNVLIALHDRAPQLKVSEDRLSVTGEKGYCMARATHGVNKGTWYFEVNIDEMSDGSATRLGWSQGLGNLQGPLGYDKFSYSWRSRKGTKFHESKGFHYCDTSYGQGDTLGFLIHLPQKDDTIPLPPIYKDKPLVKFKSYLYYEEKDEVQYELKHMKPHSKSKIVCYKNGKNMGAAFENINAGLYYPAVSLYKSCTISLNFGPKFKYPPGEKCKPFYDAAHEAIIEQTMTDLLFFTENKGKLRLDTL